MKLVSKQYLLPFVLITLLFFMWGFARAILDVLNKHFQEALSISITQSTLIQATTYLGYFLMAASGGHHHHPQGLSPRHSHGAAHFRIGVTALHPRREIYVIPDIPVRPVCDRLRTGDA